MRDWEPAAPVCQISLHVRRLCIPGQEQRRCVTIVVLRALLRATDISVSYFKHCSAIEAPETSCQLFVGAAWVVKQLPATASAKRQAILVQKSSTLAVKIRYCH
jgi:hypothetical protein